MYLSSILACRWQHHVYLSCYDTAACQCRSAFFVLCHIADMLSTGVSQRYDVPSHTVNRTHTGTMCECVVRMIVKRTVGVLAYRDMNTPG